MAHTLDAVIVDADGAVHMVVVPDDDRELDDPSFNPDGYTQIRVPHIEGVWPAVVVGALGVASISDDAT